MFPLLVYQRYVAFWHDMWSIVLEPVSELPPRPSSFDKEPTVKTETQTPEPDTDTVNDRPCPTDSLRMLSKSLNPQPPFRVAFSLRKLLWIKDQAVIPDTRFDATV